MCALMFGIGTSNIAKAQETFPVNGTVEKDVIATRFVNATIHTSPTETLDDATITIYQGRIVDVNGTSASSLGNVPVREIDLKGAHIYASFIDLYAYYGTDEVKRARWDGKPHLERETPTLGGWNEAIRPEYRTVSDIEFSSETNKKYHQMGFGTVMTHLPDGIARGTAALITLGNQGNKNLVESDVADTYSFKKGSSRQDYPSSLMGATALLRQSYYDAIWYEGLADKKERNLSLEAFNEQWELPHFFETREKLEILRADVIADEFNLQYNYFGNGDEYQRAKEIKTAGGTVVIPLDFPAAWDVSDPHVSRMVSLAEMKHWEMAPANAAILAKEGVPFCITSKGCTPKDFLSNLRKAVAHGLSEEMALEALTTGPANLLGVENQLGELSVGAFANFFVANGDIFEESTQIMEQWVQGEMFQLKDRNLTDLRGTYNFNLLGELYTLDVKGKLGKPKANLKKYSSTDTITAALEITQANEQITLKLKGDKLKLDGVYRFSGLVHSESRIWDGEVQHPDGSWSTWTAVKQKGMDKEENPSRKQKEMEIGKVCYPFVAYGNDSMPTAQTVLIKNATIWTNEEEGIIEDGQILMQDGMIKAVGKSIDTTKIFGKTTPDLVVVDAKGKHVTPGIIDEHSHIAITRGVNEGTQSCTAEVSIQSSVNSEDVNIYRQLSGGVTTSQLLHGSANPIGGQSAIIKLRWGKSPQEMLFAEADPFIKFALGENVKQSNWGDRQTERFPQTRMGVEQVFYDHFIRAREYGEAWEAYEEKLSKLSRKQKRKGLMPEAPRKDIEMDVLLQILNSERFVTCHSYRQDEINMLMHVADSMGFTLNTFTHILEGYKVADKMKEHGAGGSTFSDWWAYKFEVKDAIPHNGAMLWEQDIVTAFNSDDAEMARRLNQEAAKAVKYGGVPEEEAFKFVTLNPAKLLHIDDKVGSLKAGKDADIVIWTDHPLSIYAKADQTYVDGVRYYDAREDEVQRKAIAAERARLIQKMLDAPEDGKKKKPTEKKKKHYHCDTQVKGGEI